MSFNMPMLSFGDVSVIFDDADDGIRQAKRLKWLSRHVGARILREYELDYINGEHLDHPMWVIEANLEYRATPPKWHRASFQIPAYGVSA